MGEWAALQESPFPRLWASAAVDEILSGLHERMNPRLARLAIARGRPPDVARRRRESGYWRRAGGFRTAGGLTRGSRTRARLASPPRPRMRAATSPRLLITTV